MPLLLSLQDVSDILIGKQACASICTFLTRVHGIALSSLPASGPNVRQILTEIAFGTRNLLLEHFKKFTVNGTGGLMVTKDMTQYTNLLKSWDIDDQVKAPGGAALDVLLEVGSLFVIGSEALRERIRGGAPGAAGTNPPGGRTGRAGAAGGSGNGATFAGALNVQEVRAYVSRREDSNTAAVQNVLNVL